MVIEAIVERLCEACPIFLAAVTSPSCVYLSTVISVRAEHFHKSHDLLIYILCTGPDVWPLEFPQCSGARQSPINLEADDMYRLVVSNRLRWHGYRTRPRSLTLTNNRHTSTR